MNHKLLLFLVTLFSSLSHIDANYYYFQKITADSDFTFGPVKTLCEDENGLIWFGCNNGLYHHNTLGVEKAEFTLRNQENSQSFNINSITKDSYNNLWVCSERGLFKHNKVNNKFEIQKFSLNKDKPRSLKATQNIIQLEGDNYIIHTEKSIYHYQAGDTVLSFEGQLSDESIVRVIKDKDSTIYLITSDNKIFISNDQLKNINLLYASDKRFIYSVCKDGNKYLIGYGEDGIDIINNEGTRISELNYDLEGKQHLLNNRIRQIIKRENGEIWVGTHIGIIVINHGKQTLLNSKVENGLPHRSIYAMYQGNNNSVWVGTFAGGVAYYNASNYAFNSVSIDYDKKLQLRSTVSSFCEDGEKNIWIGSEDDGSILVYDPEEKEFNDKFDPRLTKDIKSVKALSYIGNNTIAIGRIFNGNMVFYDYKKKKVIADFKVPGRFESGIFHTKYLHPKLWITGRRSILEYNVVSGESNQLFDLANVAATGRIWYLFLDSSHNLWICTDDGLYMRSMGSDSIRACFKEEDPYNLKKETIYTVCEDNNGDIWIGTKGKGVFVYAYANNSLRPAPDYDLSGTADIHSLIQDRMGNIWYNTNRGLYRYNASENMTSHFSTIDGLPSEHIRPNSAYCTEDGTLYFGSINGFTVINPEIVRENTIVPSVLLSEVSINNKALSAKNIISANSLNLSELKKIKLKPSQNTLGFKVISNNYIKPEKNRFMYRLLNYDDRWIEVGQNHNISFTRVPSGKYIFEVQGSNNDNLWSKEPYRLEIYILPPYYRRWYALLTYLIIIVVGSYLIIKEMHTKMTLRKEITAERYKSQANELIYAERLKFFTNISHELRTPLSLIISPIRSLLKRHSNNEEVENLLKIVDRNANRLLKITDQALDLRMLEVGTLKPVLAQNDIIEIATDVYLCFEHQIIAKEINFSFTADYPKINTIIDGDMIEKVLYNLLSNAVKHTPEREHIFISIKKKNLIDSDYDNYICAGKKFTGKAIEVTIRDTGKGIKAQLLPHIFERFSKGNESHQSSSGIGLHMCKEYSEMNDGNILITSVEGIGSTFILNLPVKDETDFEKTKRKEIVKHDFTTKEKEKQAIPTKKQRAFKHTVLLTEDNDDLRTYLKTFLSQHFTVITAKSGEQALDILEDLMPDLLITDVSMPGISGIELTQQLKEDPAKHHLPIIVMTAHTERKYQMESVLRGADAFLTKPIEESLLLAHINNVISKHDHKPKKQTEQQETHDDESFVQRVESIIEENLHNTQFGINDLLVILNISKSTLDRKIKAETLQNPSGFIRDIRLKNAIKLMNTNKFNIDEIATYVGFNSSSYFIRTFKGKYGITPREYKKKNVK